MQKILYLKFHQSCIFENIGSWKKPLRRSLMYFVGVEAQHWKLRLLANLFLKDLSTTFQSI